MEIKHPEVAVKLTGTDGNAFAVIGAVQVAMRRAGISKDEIDEFATEAMSSDYDHLLATAMNWVKIS